MIGSASTVFQALGAAPQPFKLTADAPVTLVIGHGLTRVRLIGMFFDTDKAFLLPSAMAGIRGIRRQYELHPNANLLIVGHTDTSGQKPHNLKLSRERASAIAAYLSDDVQAWEKLFHDDGKRSSLTWGTHEVQLMLSALPAGQEPFFPPEMVDGKDSSLTDRAVRQFQEAAALTVDGIVGPKTRTALITSYMALDDTSLPKGASITTHGCGESFPVGSVADGQHIAEDRRVDAFFFDGPIEPPAPSSGFSEPGSPEFPGWLAQVTETEDFTADANQALVKLFIRLLDADLNPRPGVDYVLEVGPDQFVSRTKPDGSIDHLVLRSAGTGTLTVEGQSFSLDIQNLTPLPAILGVQQRLNNLSYNAGAESGQLTPETQAALRDFQRDLGLPATGQADAPTIAALTDTYGQ